MTIIWLRRIEKDWRWIVLVNIAKFATRKFKSWPIIQFYTLLGLILVWRRSGFAAPTSSTVSFSTFFSPSSFSSTVCSDSDDPKITWCPGHRWCLCILPCCLFFSMQSIVGAECWRDSVVGECLWRLFVENIGEECLYRESAQLLSPVTGGQCLQPTLTSINCLFLVYLVLNCVF